MSKKISITILDRVHKRLQEIGNVSGYLTSSAYENDQESTRALRYLRHRGWTNRELERAAYRMSFLEVDFMGNSWVERLYRYIEVDAGGYIDQARYDDVKRDMNLVYALLVLGRETRLENGWIKAEIEGGIRDDLPGTFENPSK